MQSPAGAEDCGTARVSGPIERPTYSRALRSMSGHPLHKVEEDGLTVQGDHPGYETQTRQRAFSCYSSSPSSPSCSSATHAKLAASSMLPDPLYMASFGYAHSGRVRPCQATPAAARAVEIIESGATPFSTQFTTAPNASNWSVPYFPPLQWAMPGTKNARPKCSAARAP
jgi:hypothetical protein